MLKRLSLTALAALLAGLLFGCGNSPPLTNAATASAQLVPVALDPGKKLRVVATTSIVADVVRQVGGEQTSLTTLLGTGVDPHSYVATPADVAAVLDADVVFSSGAGLEEGLVRLFRGAAAGVTQIELSDGLELLPAQSGGKDRGTVASGQQVDVDPHVWFDVRNVIEWVATIERALSKLDPANSVTYRANAESYRRELEALDVWIVQQVELLPQDRRRLVTNHQVFQYFAKRYGFEQVGAIYPISPSAEPSAQDIANLEEAIRTYGLPAVFTESTVSRRLAEQVAKDTGVKLVGLYTESLGAPGSGAESYLDLMRYDVRSIVDALK